jgi:hypothetical protein
MREAAGGGGARDTQSKTRTPHKDVGNEKHEQKLWEDHWTVMNNLQNEF